MTVQLISKDVLYAALHKQILLYPQTKVEDTVRTVGLSIGPSQFFDEARQSKAELSRVTLKDVLININWIGFS